jgi:bifunctional non-homologous end joining protein LigD
MAGDALKTYKAKRNFGITSEPAKGGQANEAARSFVIQKHWATRLHYDFRLEMDGSMKSWAVPKGPSLDPRDKRMAVHVEDHPISYNAFEGEIPAKQYGAGKVIIWDKGIWVPVGDPHQGYQEGNLKFELHGHKLQGKWALIRMKGKGEKQEPWLLIKEKDPVARPAEEFSVVDALPDSVAQIATPAAQAQKPPLATLPVNKRSAKAGKAVIPATAIKAALPARLKPQLATLVDTPPLDADAWVYEIKFDGYRLLTRVEGQKIQLWTRNGNDWSLKLPALVAAIAKLNLASGWFDGEIVVLNDKGIPDFQALQNAFDLTRTDNIVYYLFDVPFYDGLDLRAVPLIERKQLLGAIFKPSSMVRFSDTFDAPQHQVQESACRMGLEGVIVKIKTSGYTSRRSPDWIKLKCTQRQEFVIGGYTDPQGSRIGIGSLLLGVHDDQGKLHYSGNVGTGFDSKTLANLRAKMDALAQSSSPFAEKTDNDRKAHWVKPTLLAEVSFGEWTQTGKIRHSVFHGLRTDKKAEGIIRELPAHLRADTSAPAPVGLPAALKITHPERVIDTSTGLTKLDLIQYYSLVGPLMMAHLKARPVSLVRAPDGISGQLFFQKHVEKAQMLGIKLLDPKLDPDHAALLEVAKPEGLLSATQMNVIEFHTWNAVKTLIDKPDRMTFDLDPGEGVAWSTMQESAHLVRAFLTQLGLVSFLKTSGGKGLHVVVPLKRWYGWDTVKDFSQAIVQHLSTTLPQRFVAKSGPRNREGKIFIDYLRNGFGATTVAAWSARARPGLGVSVPIEWTELDALSSSAHWTIANIQTRLEIGNHPWKDYPASIQNLTPAMKALGFSTAKVGR